MSVTCHCQTPVDGSFSITGPDSLILGTTGVWTITSHLHDLYNDVTLDVLAPLHVPDAMSIDHISIASVGEAQVQLMLTQ